MLHVAFVAYMLSDSSLLKDDNFSFKWLNMAL